MITVETLAELRAHIAQARSEGKRIGFVPTMGNLHNGHMTLIDEAAEQCDFVVASIFVNPLQFNDKDDLKRYPRTLSADQMHLKDHDCDLLFFPDVDEVYPNGQAQQTLVGVPEVSQGLCGGSRPGHFDGVSTVVSKLFNMVQPDAAFFGEKDFQQLAVIRRMVADLCMPIEIIGVPTCREPDGLAMSSRNGYLSAEERVQAVHLSKALITLKEQIRAGSSDFPMLIEEAKAYLNEHGLTPDYVEICRVDTLKQASTDDKELVILGAVFLGSARLIDNFTLTLS